MVERDHSLFGSGPQLPATVLDAVVELSWPDFIEVKGCVVLRNRFTEKNFELWWKKYSEQPYAIERVLNEVHFYDLVDDSYDDSQLPLLEEAAKRLRDAWSAALKQRFPDTRFTVEYFTEPEAYGPTVSFHQAEGCPGCP